MDENQAAAFLGYSPRALQKWRGCGSGPKFVKVSGRSIRYRRKDLIQWAEENIVSNTGETI
ncbi:MAG: helix-turn-helix domain-containing protein [Proteobacteria bacterium]|nr:helix-turn-helix domain-containing protein [Pseudomonadota bacterium]